MCMVRTATFMNWRITSSARGEKHTSIFYRCASGNLGYGGHQKPRERRGIISRPVLALVANELWYPAESTHIPYAKKLDENFQAADV